MNRYIIFGEKYYIVFQINNWIKKNIQRKKCYGSNESILISVTICNTQAQNKHTHQEHFPMLMN